MEKDSVRPADEKERKKLRGADRYGDAKLSGEEALKDQRDTEHGGFPWVALRFADIIGPRDTTDRWPTYHLWVKFFEDIGIPVAVPEQIKDVKESLTYVKDAAKAILNVIEKDKSVWDNAYNVAMDEEFTLGDIINKIADTMEVKDIQMDHFNGESSNYLFPSVFRGPMDMSKAKSKLGFVATDADTAFKETVEWYDQRLISNETEREMVLKRFVNDILPRDMKDQFYIAVDKFLEKNGVVKERYRKKRKGDIGGLDEQPKQEL